MDVFSPQKRSAVMAAIRSRHTMPELAVRSALHRLGLRFTVNGPKNSSLPGKPDIVLPKHRTVVFVHGCFWHGHPNCKHFRIPKTRTEFWTNKIQNNQARDRRNVADLENLGWRVLVVWECEVESPSADWIRNLLGRIGSPES